MTRSTHDVSLPAPPHVPQHTPVLRALWCVADDAAASALIGQWQASGRGRLCVNAVASDDLASFTQQAWAFDVVVWLVDAHTPGQASLQRHIRWAALLGIRHGVLAVSQALGDGSAAHAHQALAAQVASWAESLGDMSLAVMPVGAQPLDSPALLAHLQALAIAPQPALSLPLALAVQALPDPQAQGQLLQCTVVQGEVLVGDEVVVCATGRKASVRGVVAAEGGAPNACAAQALALHLDAPLQASPGDVLSRSRAPLEMSDQFEVTLLWLQAEEGLVGRHHELQLASQTVPVSLTGIKHRIHPDTGAREACKTLVQGSVAVCHIATTRPVVYDTFAASRALGRFVLVDRVSRATVAVGLITHSLRRSQNVHRQALSITRADREKLNHHPGKVVWFTGLSGSGKSTLANALEVQLHRQGYRTYLLDGDNIRKGLNKDLGFSEADRVENIRRIAEVAQLMRDAGLVVLTAFISPYRQDREMARELIGSGDFIEVYVDTSLAVCEQRDVKGLYQKARAGQIPNMTGVSSPYEAPLSPAYIARAGTQTVDAIVQDLMALLKDMTV
jgi:bifunctional enzyme CysN/CysC